MTTDDTPETSATIVGLLNKVPKLRSTSITASEAAIIDNIITTLGSALQSMELQRNSAVNENADLMIKIERLQKNNATLRGLLDELYATVIGECPRLLDEDRGGSGWLALEIQDALGKK